MAKTWYAHPVRIYDHALLVALRIYAVKQGVKPSVIVERALQAYVPGAPQGPIPSQRLRISRRPTDPPKVYTRRKKAKPRVPKRKIPAPHPAILKSLLRDPPGDVGF